MCDAGDEAEKTLTDLHDFINERWKGMKPVAWGSTLDEAQLTAAIYQDLLGLGNEQKAFERRRNPQQSKSYRRQNGPIKTNDFKQSITIKDNRQ